MYRGVTSTMGNPKWGPVTQGRTVPPVTTFQPQISTCVSKSVQDPVSSQVPRGSRRVIVVHPLLPVTYYWTSGHCTTLVKTEGVKGRDCSVEVVHPSESVRVLIIPW